MILRSLIIRWVARLYYPPFLWLFQAYYWLAIRLSCLLVCRVEGVKSIYLVGSLARGEAIYGLSDIDFKIFVAGQRDRQTHERIRRCFAFLRRFFPVLGPPDEKGIYFLDAFEADYRHYPLVQYLFEPTCFTHQLVWGEELIATLPLKSWDSLDRVECAFSRLKYWLEKVYVLADCGRLSPAQEQHLFFKAVRDIGLLTHRLVDPKSPASGRAEVLRASASALEDPYRQLLDNLIREHEALYRIRINSSDESFQLFKRMVASCAETAAARDQSGFSSVSFTPSDPPCRAEDLAQAAVLRELSAKISNVGVLVWPHLPLSPFDFRFFNRPVFLVDCCRPLSLEEFHNLKAYYRANLRNRTVVLLREYPQFVSSLDSDLLDHWGSFPGSSDLVHLSVDHRLGHPLTQPVRERILGRTEACLEQGLAALSHREFGRLDRAAFPLFLFNALRMAIFAVEFRKGQWLLPRTPVQVAEYLIGQTPLSPSFPARVAEQFERVTQREGRFDERLLPKSRALLSGMLDVSRDGHSLDALKTLNETPDEHRLGISVAIITADRPLQLERCLHSLARLSRPPEELILVDNGHRMAARPVIDRVHVPFPVRVRHDSRSGSGPRPQSGVADCQGRDHRLCG